MASAGRSGSRRTTKRQAILDGAAHIMLTDGYGAVTFRSVATAAVVAPGLVQYYFPSLDELFIAVLRENTDRLITDLTNATDSEQPLRAVWAYANNPTGTALLMQFMALANQLPQIGSIIGEGGERVRQTLLQGLSKKWPEYGLNDTELTPGAVLFLLSAIPRMVHLEDALGTVTGHTEALALVERFLERVEPRSS
jgi:AcrR family transcriptional regulator